MSALRASLMAGRRSEKELARRARVEKEQAAGEARAKRLERRIYIGIAATLLLLGAITLTIVSSKRGTGGGGPRLTPVAAAPQPSSPPQTGPASSGARAVLLANTRSANQVLDGPISSEIARLKGVPIVINQWASWCTNCRAEFPFFQQAGRQYAARVAFVGLDSQDARGDALAFLKQFPVDYPSVFDQDASQAQSLGAGTGWPTTIYLDKHHKITYVHVGGYASLQLLEQDINSYT